MGLDPEFCPRAAESGSRFDRRYDPATRLFACDAALVHRLFHDTRRYSETVSLDGAAIATPCDGTGTTANIRNSLAIANLAHADLRPQFAVKVMTLVQ